MSQRANKRQRTSLSAQSSLSTASLDDIPTREALIARLLNEKTRREKSPSAAVGPLIQDLSASPEPSAARPSFVLPDLTSSTSLLSRVQSFLPQLQQANADIQDAGGLGGFQLIDQDEQGLDEEAEEDERIRTQEAEAEDMHPQIVMNLALGVMEEKDGSTDSEEGDSSNTSSDEEVPDADEASTSETDHDSENSEEDEEKLEEDNDLPEAEPLETLTAEEVQQSSQAERKLKRKALIQELT